MAVSQGIAVTWWYRASRQQATVADLHNVWASGSSVVSAITAYKAFNFTALATVFVATLPVNGILLQNASGFETATLNSDGTVENYAYAFQNNIPYLVNNLDGWYKSYNVNNTCKGECAATLIGVGFEATCTPSSIPFHLPLDSATNATASDTSIFSSEFGWDASAPTVFTLNTVYKQTDSCQGSFIANNCTLQLVKVNYPVDVIFNATGEYSPTWFWRDTSGYLTPSHASSTYVPSEKVGDITLAPETKTTAYGGIAAALKSHYDASAVLHPTANGTALKYNGQFTQQLQPSSMGYNDDGTPKVLPDKCNTSFPIFGWSPQYTDPWSFLMESVRTTLFYSSVFAADQDMTSIQTIMHQNDILT